MSMKEWKATVVATPGAAEAVTEIKEELEFVLALTALRESGGLSQRDLARRLGITQPRVAAIERAQNLTIQVLKQYIQAAGYQLEISARQGRKTIPLTPARRPTSATHSGLAASEAPERSRRQAGDVRLQRFDKKVEKFHAAA